MISRVGAHLLTGPLAFLVGGLFELGTLAVLTVRGRARERRTPSPSTGMATDARGTGGL